MAVSPTQKPLELILARNLMSSLSTPAFLTNEEGTLVYYNEAAGKLLGKRFEELGDMGPEVWSHIGPVDADGRPIPLEKLPLTVALRHGSPAHAHLRIRSFNGAERTIEVSALPIVGVQGSPGAMAFFWMDDEAQDMNGAAQGR
jgi:PAS domain-containing protein